MYGSVNFMNSFLFSFIQTKQLQTEFRARQIALLEQQLLSQQIDFRKLSNETGTGAIIFSKNNNWSCSYCKSKNEDITNCRNCGAPNI